MQRDLKCFSTNKLFVVWWVRMSEVKQTNKKVSPQTNSLIANNVSVCNTIENAWATMKETNSKLETLYLYFCVYSFILSQFHISLYPIETSVYSWNNIQIDDQWTDLFTTSLKHFSCRNGGGHNVNNNKQSIEKNGYNRESTRSYVRTCNKINYRYIFWREDKALPTILRFRLVWKVNNSKIGITRINVRKWDKKAWRLV